MASLLRQLQKKKSNDPARAREAVLRPVGDTLDREIAASLDELFSARESRKRASGASETETKHREADDFRSAESSEQLVIPAGDDSVPWWLREPPKNNPQVDALVGIACEMLMKKRASGECVDLPSGISAALSDASDSLKHELRLSRRIIEQAEHELRQLFDAKGPLRPLFEDPLVSEVYVDGYHSVRVVRGGDSLEAPFRFRTPDEFRLFLESLFSVVGRQVDERCPWMNAVLGDQWKTRVCFLHPAIHDGNEIRLCFRIPRPHQTSMFEVLQARAVPATVASWLSEVVAASEANILVVGPSGSGKTMMLSALLSAANSEERVMVIENFPEVAVPTANLEKLISRPAETPGAGEVMSRELIQLAMTRDAHRLVVGDIGPENTVAFLEALEAGWQGSLATVQAEGSSDALWRVFDMASGSGGIAGESLMRRVMRSVHLIVSMKRIDGAICVDEISEVLRSSDRDFQLLPIVRYVGMQSGKRQWQLTSRSSIWMQRMKERGVSLLPGPHLLSARDEEQVA